jgi:hypothetical protein
VHVAAFPRDGRLPASGASRFFEVELARDGRERAVRVRRPVAAAAMKASDREQVRHLAREYPSAPSRRYSAPVSWRFFWSLAWVRMPMFGTPSGLWHGVRHLKP